ncbi:MAG TPA: helix-turn-helix domain-containing protein, partial [Lautropia sp.]|nr:helix-turn-helix domain-containing protein [Lautropia sp.]
VRRLLLIGHLEEAASSLEVLDGRSLPPLLRAVAHLAAAELALRSLHTGSARAALDRARKAAERAGVRSLLAEVAEARAVLDRSAARRFHADHEQALRLDEVEALLASGALVVDACRRGLRTDTIWLAMARRPVLFALLRALAEAWPGDADRDALILRAFRTRRPDESHRARLRVEISRLRALIAPLAQVEASTRGFAITPKDKSPLVVLLPPIDGEQASLLALLGDGEAWSTSALALAMADSQRTIQRALAELEAEGKVRSIGRARAQRWLSPPLAGFTTILLLPGTLPSA